MKKVTSAKMAVRDDWVVAAMTDDEMVVELLIRLKHGGTVVADNPAVKLPPLRWGIRQRRSRSSRFGVGVNDLVSIKKKDVNSARASPNTPLSWSGGSGSGGGSASPSAVTADGFEDTSRQASCSTSTGSGSKALPTYQKLPPLRLGIRQWQSQSSRFGVGVNDLVSIKKKDVDSARASPNTPLSWSGGSGSGGGSASPSAVTADGFEDTSRQASCCTSTGSGSKVFPTNEISSSFSKRLKKKKSSSELKNEENLKLKERVDLKKELANLRSTFDEHNVRNQRLKRIKLDLNSGHVKNESPVNLIHQPQHERLPESKSCNIDVKISNSEIQGGFFFIPDLNMAPSEEDIWYGTC